jgi:peptidoglycan/LPS O-acetylase OafA/YrhL
MSIFYEHTKKIELIAMVIYLVSILILVILKKEWVVSAVIGALTGIVNFRIQVKGYKDFVNKQNAFIVTSNFLIRFFLIGLVLFFSFRNDTINPLVVFSFIIIFHLFIISSVFFNFKNNPTSDK